MKGKYIIYMSMVNFDKYSIAEIDSEEENYYIVDSLDWNDDFITEKVYKPNIIGVYDTLQKAKDHLDTILIFS